MVLSILFIFWHVSKKTPKGLSVNELSWSWWWSWENFCIINSWISIIIKSFSSIFLVYHYLVMSVLNRMAYLLESTFSLYLNSNYLTRRTLVTILRIIPKHFSQTMLPKGKIILYYQKYEDTSEPLKLIIMK